MAGGKEVSLGTLSAFEGENPFPLPDDAEIYANHAYVVIDAKDTNADNKVDEIVLANPWDFAITDDGSYKVKVPVSELGKVSGELTIWDHS